KTPMPKGCGQAGELGQAVQRQPVAKWPRRAIGPADGHRHPPGRATLAHQHKLSAQAAPLEDDREALPGQRVERVGDENRVRNRARAGGAGPTRGRWAPQAPWSPRPPALGIARSRTGKGRNVPAFSATRSPSRKPGAPTLRLTQAAVRPSTPGVFAPVLPASRSNATSSVAGSHTRLNKSS